MRGRTSIGFWPLFLVACVVTCALTPATAAAIVFPTEIELRLEIGAFPAIVVSSMGSVTVNGSGAPGHLDSITFGGGELTGTALQPVTDPGAFPITALRMNVANGAGAIAEVLGGRLVGTAPLLGAVKVCLFGNTSDCSQAVTNVNVPLTAAGSGGAGVATGDVNLTVLGAPWTSGTATVHSITRMGYARGPASGTSSTARAGGEIQLVTPIFVTTNVAASSVVPVFGILTLRFVPEPATILLLGAGVVALAAAGRSRPLPP